MTEGPSEELPAHVAEPIEPEGVGPSWGMLALALAGIVVLGTFFLGARPEESAPEERDIPQMSATPYRPTIERLEYTLYAESSEGLSDAREIVRVTRKLAADMREWESRLYLTPYITRVGEFAGWVENRAKRGFDPAALTASRRRWESIRTTVFEPEDWFLEW